MGRSVPTSRNKMTQHAAASVNSTAPFNIPFMPAALHGHNMDHTTYRTRQQRATDHHLAALLSSKEYLAFKATKDQHSMQRRVWFRRGIWGALGMAVIVLLSSMAARGVFMNGVGQHGGGIQVQQGEPWSSVPAQPESTWLEEDAFFSDDVLIEQWWRTYTAIPHGIMMKTIPNTCLLSEYTPPLHPSPTTHRDTRSVIELAVVITILGAVMLMLKRDNDRHARQLHAATVHIEQLARRALDCSGDGSGDEDANMYTMTTNMHGEMGLRHAVDTLANAMASREQQTMTLQEEVTSMTVLHQLELRKAEDRLVEVRGWLNQAQGQLQNTQTALSDKEASCRHLKLQVKDLHGQLDMLRAQLHDGTSPAAKAVRVQMQEALELVRHDKEIAEEAVEGLKADIDAARYALAKHVGLAPVDNVDGDGDGDDKEEEGSAGTSSHMMPSLDVLVAAVVDASTCNKKQADTLEKEVEVLKQQVQEARTHAEKAAALKTQLDTMQLQLVAATVTNDQQQETIVALESQLQAAITAQEAATATTSLLHTQVATLTQQLSDTETSAADTLAQLQAAQDTITSQAKELCNLRDEVSTLQQVLQEETSGGRVLQQQGSVLQTTLEQAQRAQREAEATITTLTQHNAQLQQALESTHSAAEEQQALNEEALKIREVLIGTLREEMEEAAVEGSRVLEEIKAQLEQVTQERDAAVKAMTEHEVNALREQLEAFESTLTGRKMSSMQADLTSLQKQLKQKETEALSLAHDLDLACAARTQYKEQAAYLQEQLDAQVRELTNLRHALVADGTADVAGGDLPGAGGDSSQAAGGDSLSSGGGGSPARGDLSTAAARGGGEAAAGGQVGGEAGGGQAGGVSVGGVSVSNVHKEQQDGGLLLGLVQQLQHKVHEGEEACRSLEAELSTLRRQHDTLLAESDVLERQVTNLKELLSQTTHACQTQHIGTQGDAVLQSREPLQALDTNAQRQATTTSTHPHGQTTPVKAQHMGKRLGFKSPVEAAQADAAALSFILALLGPGQQNGQQHDGHTLRPQQGAHPGTPLYVDPLQLRKQARSLARMNGMLRAQLLLLAYRHAALRSEQSDEHVQVECATTSVQQQAQPQQAQVQQQGESSVCASSPLAADEARLAALVGRLEQGLLTLSGDNTQLKEQVAYLQSSHKQLTTQLAHDAQLVSDMQEDMTVLQARLSEREADCVALQEQLHDLTVHKDMLEARLGGYEHTAGPPSPPGGPSLQHDAAHHKLRQLTEKVGGMVRSMEITQANVTAALEYDAMVEMADDGDDHDATGGSTAYPPAPMAKPIFEGGLGAKTALPFHHHVSPPASLLDDVENTPPPIRRGGGIPTSSPYGFAAANAVPIGSGGKPSRSLKSHALTMDGGEESVTSEQTSTARLSLASVVSRGEVSSSWLRR